MYKVKQAGGLSLLLAIALLSPIATNAQTTTTSRESNFEIIAVDGNYLVVRDQNGTRELTVPPDFRFTVDGKSLAVSDLKAGMKGTAVVTTTTTQRPVYVTTIKQGTVTNQTERSIQIKEDNGKVAQIHARLRSIRAASASTWVTRRSAFQAAEPGRQGQRDYRDRGQAGDRHGAGRGCKACRKRRRHLRPPRRPLLRQPKSPRLTSRPRRPLQSRKPWSRNRRRSSRRQHQHLSNLPRCRSPIRRILSSGSSY